MAQPMLVQYWLEVIQQRRVTMHRKIFSSVRIAVMLSITVVLALPAWAVEKNTAVPSEAAPTSTAAGAVKPPVAIPTDDFVPTAELVSVHFDTASSAIRPGDAAKLTKNAGWLKANPRNAVLVEGAADQRGNLAYNQALAERRAQAVKSYLVAQGVESDRIMTMSYGERRLACPTNVDPCWTDNRRVDFQVKVLNKQAP
jgi:peptidoglycan-associated lipoprotein